MTVFNVSVAVVELITAETAQQAIRALERQLMEEGFEPLEGHSNAFESEEQPCTS